MSTINGNLDFNPAGQPPVATGWTDEEVAAITEHGNSQLVVHATEPVLPEEPTRKARPRSTRGKDDK